MINLNKIFKRLKSYFKIFLWKIIYGKRIKFGRKNIFYSNTNLIIEKKVLVKIGNNCFFNRNTSINCMEKIEIGNNCIFGENICIYDHDHCFSNLSIPIKEQGYKTSPIYIGDNCWIGSNVVILKGVKIGSNVVIGAGTIVTKDIQDKVVVYSKQNEIRKEY